MSVFACYARCSTEEHQQYSVVVQVDEATRFGLARGWTLHESPFIDEGISRAEFQRRPGLWAMVAAAKRKEFDILVVRDETRLGGDMLRTTMILSELSDLGIRIFHYADGQEVQLESSEDRLVATVRNYASELQREKIASQTREGMAWRARNGKPTGRVPFGIEVAVVHSDGGKKPEKDYRKNDEKAATVLRIFRMYVEGNGIRRIAKKLNDEHVPSPLGKSWAPSCIRDMLRNETNRGILTWGREGKAYKGGTKVRVARPANMIERSVREDLRIVPEDLWLATQQRIEKLSRTGGRRKGRAPKHLLSGLLRCIVCGGPMHTANGKQAATVIKVYLCSHRWHRGDGVCVNSARAPVKRLNDAVIAWIEQNVLRDEVYLAALDELRERLRKRATQADNEIPRLATELKKKASELKRLGRLAATTDAPPVTIIDDMRRLENERVALVTRIEVLRTAPKAIDLELDRMESEARKRTKRFRTLLRRNPEEGRAVVEALLEGPLVAEPVETPEGRRFRLTGTAVIGPLLVETGITTGGDPSGNRTRVTGVRGRCPNR